MRTATFLRPAAAPRGAARGRLRGFFLASGAARNATGAGFAPGRGGAAPGRRLPPGARPAVHRQHPAANSSFNRAGGTITITRPAGTTGRFIATFGGLLARLAGRSAVRVTG